MDDRVQWSRLRAIAMRQLDSIEDAAASLEAKYPALIVPADLALCQANPPAVVTYRRLRRHALDDLCRAEAAAASLGLPPLFAPTDFPRTRMHTTPPRAIQTIVANVLALESDGQV